MNADGEIIPLEYDAGWPVEVDDILIDPIIAEGTYDITARFCRPDYSDGVDWEVIATDNTVEGNPTIAHADDDMIYREDGATFPGSWGDFNLDITLDGATDVITITLNNPAEANGRWDLAGERLSLYRDYDSDGDVDWAIIYYQDSTWAYWTYDGATWTGPLAVPGIFSTSYASQTMTVSWVDSDGIATGRVAGHLWEINGGNPPTSDDLFMCVPYAAFNTGYLRPDKDDTSAYLPLPEFADLPLVISMKSDCDFVYIEFVSGGETIETIDIYTQGGNDFDETSPYVSGIGTTTVLFEIPRSELRVGNCNERAFWMDYDVEGKNTGSVARSVIEPIVIYDCGPAEIKKFLEIYEKETTPGDPGEEEDIYCEDFEDPCDFYDVWATFDMKPDWGPNGALDTWTWTDQRSNSPSHSFRSTAFDTYLGNQFDVLLFDSSKAGLDFSAYDTIDIEFSHWMEGDAIMVGDILTIQDGGYVEYQWDAGGWTQLGDVFYDNDWTDELFNIDVLGTVLEVRFVFFSDPAFCYEGWYVDDFCLTGYIGGTDDTEEWILIHDSHSHEQIMDGECLEHTFFDDWEAEEGEYLICVWLQTIDDCHRAVHGSGEPGYPDPFCIEVTVDNILELEDEAVYIDPECPLWEGDDMHIFSDVCNIGTLDAENVQVQVTVDRGEIQDTLQTGFDCAVDTVDTVGSPDAWFQSAIVGRSDWHFTETGSPGDCYLANFDEGTMQYLVPGPRTTEWVASPHLLTGADRNFDVQVSFDAAWALPNVPGVVDWHIAVMDDSSGYLYYFTDPYDPNIADGPLSNGDGSFVSITDIPVSSLIGSLYDAGHTTDADTDLSVMIFMFKDHPTADSGLSWSGIKLDNFLIKKLVIQPDSTVFEETQIIPELNITDCTTLEFIWEAATVGRYVITETILTADEDPGNNQQITTCNVINYEQDLEDGTIEFVDHTGGGPCYWMVDDCCGGSLWVGDPATTMYGNNWDQELYIAPGGNVSIPDAAGEDLVFDTWHQMSPNDVGLVQYSYDEGVHWITLETIIGDSSVLPDGEFEWGPVTVPLPGDTDQVRFRFISNNSTTNRGWMIDNVYIDGVIDDDCDSMENFLCMEHQTGNFWKIPDAYYYWFGVPVGFIFGWPPVAPQFTFGNYDTLFPANWNFPVEIYAPDQDCSFDWTIDTEKVFYGWYEAYMMLDITGPWIGGDDFLAIQYSPDGTTFNTLFAPTFWAGQMNAPVVDAMMGDETTARFRFTSGSDLYAYWDGVQVNDLRFFGMKDLNAPTTTATLSGTFDDVYDYYTSEVAVQLTAVDDVSGVAAIYYELDGTQYTYNRPFVIEGDGEHTLCYWAVDNEGNVETKKCVAPFRIDETGPSVEITGPAPGIYLMGNKLLDSDKYVFLFGGFEVTATVDVDEAPLATVEFYFNDVLVGEDTTAPFKLRIAEKNSGGCTIKVVAIDVLGEDDEDTLEIDTYIKIF
jgi:hypothetical protein